MDIDTGRRRLLASSGMVVGSLFAWQFRSTGSRPPRQGRSSAWPMAQRDPGGTSHAPEATPPKDGVTIRWQQQIDSVLGANFPPTPIVANGLVYAVGRELLCVDAATGAVRFREHTDGSGSPAVAPARAYRSPTIAFATATRAVGIHGRGGSLIAGVSPGHRRWQTTPLTQGVSLFGSGSHRSDAVAVDETVFMVVGEKLLAIDASSGRIRWRADGGGSRPVVYDGTVYVPNFGMGVIGYDVDTGERTFGPADETSMAGSVTATSGLLVVGTSDGLAGIGYDGTTHWEFAPPQLDHDTGAVAIANGVAFAGMHRKKHDQLVAVDIEDGTELWRSNIHPERSPRFAPPAVADGVVYYPTEDRGMVAVNAADGRVRWRFEPGDEFGPLSPAALVGETLYVHGNGTLYALTEA
ncbi:PQQ-binding-like beta-propeller repeat protein [Halocatena halophila]|uniref:PQQ-binding-like beta-propeller repeat protein n=1 Tax=Halocatena halophila TaxID=2814576 RepID=UPI002ED5D7E1